VSRVRQSVTYLLMTFRQHVIDYFDAAHWDPHSNDWEGSEDAPELRRQINEQIRAVTVALHFVGITTMIDYEPPRATGGLAGRISLVDNIFNLPRLRLPHTQLIDNLDRAIGIYRSWLGPLWWKVFNMLGELGEAVANPGLEGAVAGVLEPVEEAGLSGGGQDGCRRGPRPARGPRELIFRLVVAALDLSRLLCHHPARGRWSCKGSALPRVIRR